MAYQHSDETERREARTLAVLEQAATVNRTLAAEDASTEQLRDEVALLLDTIQGNTDKADEESERLRLMRLELDAAREVARESQWVLATTGGHRRGAEQALRRHDHPTYAGSCEVCESNYRYSAKQDWHEEGRIEVDDNAQVNISEDGGAYVQAWVWMDSRNA